MGAHLSQDDVFDRGQVREEVVGLEDESEAAAPATVITSGTSEH